MPALKNGLPNSWSSKIIREDSEKVEILMGWQGPLCQFFTRDAIARYCLNRLTFPKDLLSMRLLEPAAGRGAFIIPLIPRLIESCKGKRGALERLPEVIRAYEVDQRIARRLRSECAAMLRRFGVDCTTAVHVARRWIINEDFLEAELNRGFTHIVGNPPYIRWDAIPKPLIEKYREQFDSFKARADIYVAFIEKSLTLLTMHGQIGFLCPGNWTRNTYGAYVRRALTHAGRLETIIDLTDVDSFEQTADAYPSFFVFSNGLTGNTKIMSVASSKKGLAPTAKAVHRHFPPSSAPFVLANDRVARFVERAKRTFPTLEVAGCSIRVGSATGCNSVFLGSAEFLPVEPSRRLRFVNARSIRDAKVHWSGTHIVNVFNHDGKPVDLEAFPKLKSYLFHHKKELKARAKAGQAKCWWRTIDVLHSDWYAARKLLVADISSQPVIGLDKTGFCAGSGVYQIKSSEWPLEELLVLLSAGILGIFVSALSQQSINGFSRFQKQAICTIPLPRWNDIAIKWRRQFREARLVKDTTLALGLVANLYNCDPDILMVNTARDWADMGRTKINNMEVDKTCAREALDGKRTNDGKSQGRKGRTYFGSTSGSIKDWYQNQRNHSVA